MDIKRLQILITGQVQGVGFRPHVYQLAKLLQLTGWVQNNPSGVLIEIQGTSTADFLKKLAESPPALARIDRTQIKSISLANHEDDFKIIASQRGEARTMISPDTCICPECLNELFDPQSRYYRYPFLNCTQCGPRLTITRNLPYDRNQTTMHEFPLCSGCLNDYQDPCSRRYHAQPTACAECGPALSSDIESIAQAIIDGKIVALKGLGGYQLLCDARNANAINTLRHRKQRKEKPFALMVGQLNVAESIVEVSSCERSLLNSSARPIVLLKQRDFTLPQSIAPKLSSLGIMLPSTPVHYLLFNTLDKLKPFILVVTSANLNGEPLIIDDIEARDKLTSIADLIVTNTRQIVTRADDSVMRVINQAPMFIRRARGYVPHRITLPYPIPSTLALGGHLKNTFCITRDDEAFVSQHIGSLTYKPTLEFFHESLRYWLQLLDITPERIACDLHPDFYTTQLAYDFNLPVIPVQHHHAHLVSVACEHHLLKPAIGLALDGYGYGADGQAWGGELFQFDHSKIERIGCFSPLAAPGGDLVARQPWRMGASVLHKLNLNHRIAKQFHNESHAPLLAELLNLEASFPLTSSCGRLFDAASALLGITHTSSYEGQAAMQLESLVTELEVLPDGWYVEQEQIDFLPTLLYLLNADKQRGANVFHGTLIAGLASWLTEAATKMSTKNIVLSGGCFLNKILTEGLTSRLTHQGFNVHWPKQLPPNDGGLSFGQAWIAGTKDASSCV